MRQALSQWWIRFIDVQWGQLAELSWVQLRDQLAGGQVGSIDTLLEPAGQDEDGRTAIPTADAQVRESKKKAKNPPLPYHGRVSFGVIVTRRALMHLPIDSCR